MSPHSAHVQVGCGEVMSEGEWRGAKCGGLEWGLSSGLRSFTSEKNVHLFLSKEDNLSTRDKMADPNVSFIMFDSALLAYIGVNNEKKHSILMPKSADVSYIHTISSNSGKVNIKFGAVPSTP